MFMGAHSVGRLGLMESDPLVIQSEQKLLGQADELVVLADASKFERRSSQLGAKNRMKKPATEN